MESRSRSVSSRTIRKSTRTQHKYLLRLTAAAIILGAGILLLTRTQSADAANPPDAYAVTSTNNLITFNTATPGTVSSSTLITGLTGADAIVGIDFRPATGQLYGLGFNFGSVGTEGQLYTININTAVATTVGSRFAMPTAIGSTLNAATSFGFDINPATDTIRVVSSGRDNFRLNPTTGALTADTIITPAGTTPVGAAYTNNFAGAAATTLYDIDSSADTLVRQGGVNGTPSPNGGVVTSVGPLGVDTANNVSFDINTTGDQLVPTNTAYATLRVSGTTALYTINLGTGAATLVGSVGGNPVINGMAILQLPTDVPPPANAFGVDTSNNLVRFNTATPGTIVSSAPITGLQPGETVLGIDFRPVNETLYALGSTGRLYTINLETAAVTQVAQLSADPADITNPFTTLNGTEFGIDFNPTSDRLRIVSDTGQDLRVNVADGSTTTDANLNPGTPNVVGVAYINSFAGATTTTLYDIDSTSDTLNIQNPPNNGTLTTVGPLGVNASAVLGFDIRDASNTAFATLVVGGTPGLYSIDLMSGAATFIGAIGGGTTLRGLAIAPAGYFATLSGLNATFTGSAANNIIIFDSAGGLLRHNRFTKGDAGFNSDFDFDSTQPGDQTLSATDPAVSVDIVGATGDDTAQIGNATVPASALAAIFTFNGQSGNDSLDLNDATDASGRNITINSGNILGLAPTNYSTVERVTLSAGSGADNILVNGTSALTFINANDGDDTILFSDGATLSGGLADGGTGNNTLNYSAYTTPVNVDLRETQSYFYAQLSGRQEPGPLSNSTATGTGVFLLNQTQTQLTFNIPYTGLTGTAISGAHFHNAPFGVNGAIVRGLSGPELGGSTLPSGTMSGIWASSDSSPLTPTLVSELLAGRIYFNIHTTPNFPSGEIRGQLNSLGLVGTATGTGGIRSFQNVTGGTASDTFTVAPSAASPININGNTPTPPASPGDSLNVDVTGATNTTLTATSTPNGFQGSYTFGNRQPVNFSGIETLSPGGTLTIDDVTVVEGDAGSVNAVFTVTLTGAASSNVSVDYVTSNGTATTPGDYQSVSGTLMFAPGQTMRTITVPVNGDTLAEGDEIFFVNLMNPTNAIINDAQGQGTITDDDAGGVLQFSAASYNVNENAGTATITVNRTGSTIGSITVNYATSNGTALSGADYGNTSGTLFFGSGDTSKSFDVPIINDSLSEGTETVNLALSLPTGGATLGAQSTATLFILDDEAPPPPDLFAVTSNNHLLRLNANAPDTVLSDVTITGLQGGENVLNIDFRPATGQLYAVGSTSRLYTIDTTTGAATQVGASGAFTLSGTDFGADFNPVVDRLRVVSDADQNLRLNPNDGTLTSADTALTYASGDVNFGANPNVTGAAYTNNFAGAGATTLYGIDSNLDVLVRQGSADGSPTSPNTGQLFTVGSLGVNTTGLAGFDIRQTNNTAYASLTSPGDTSSKLYTVNLQTGATTLVGIIGGGQFIRDIALAPAGSFQFSAAAANVAEDAGKLTVTVNRTGDTTGTATVNVATADGTATQKGDYTIRLATVTFAPGETSKSVDVFITDDGYVEGPETFTIALSSPTGDFTLDGTSSQTVTITDNDALASNPIATVPFFVRQHYIDFLNREPDPPGFTGWQNILNNCPAGNTTCDRVEVSSAFYRSDEFQVRGYFLYRFYRASLARNPTYREFMMDLSRTTGFLTDAQLEAAKVAFVADFMSRQEFKTKYDAVTDPTAYVNLLESTAGVTLSNKQALITGLQNSTETRATVLRKVIESSEVATKFFNEAFVVEAYFGYLRRDPDGAFQTWVQLLNQTNDRRVIVNGFVNSNEYVQRFGP